MSLAECSTLPTEFLATHLKLDLASQNKKMNRVEFTQTNIIPPFFPSSNILKMLIIKLKFLCLPISEIYEKKTLFLLQKYIIQIKITPFFWWWLTELNTCKDLHLLIKLWIYLDDWSLSPLVTNIDQSKHWKIYICF